MSRFVDVEEWSCSDDEYFGGDALGSSSLCSLLGADGPSEKTGDLGNACHLAILRPDLFADLVVTPPPEVSPGSGTGQKARMSDWRAGQAGKLILNASDYAKAVSMRSALVTHPLLAKGVRRPSTTIEQPLRATDSVTGLPIRIRPDGFCAPRGAVWDLKMSKSPAFHSFTGSVGRYLYHVQAALYSDVLEALTGEAPRWFWIVVGSIPPHRCACYEASEEWINLGRRLYSAALDMAITARTTGQKPPVWWGDRPLMLEDPPQYLQDEAALVEIHAARVMETVG